MIVCSQSRSHSYQKHGEHIWPTADDEERASILVDYSHGGYYPATGGMPPAPLRKHRAWTGSRAATWCSSSISTPATATVQLW